MTDTYLTNVNAQVMAVAHGYRSAKHVFCPWINLEPSDRIVGLVGCSVLSDNEIGEVYNIIEAIALVLARMGAVSSPNRHILAGSGGQAMRQQTVETHVGYSCPLMSAAVAALLLTL
jgi:hypothetical protein